MDNVIKYKVEGPLMAITNSDVSKFTYIVHPDDKVGECIIKGKDEDEVLRGVVISDGFAQTEDLLYYVIKDETGGGYTHRLCSTGETLNKVLGNEPDFYTASREDLWNDRHKTHKRHSFAAAVRALHNLRSLFAVRVNGRWAIVGGHDFSGQFLSGGYTKEDGEVARSQYGWEFLVENQPYTICYLDGDIKEKEE